MFFWYGLVGVLAFLLYMGCSNDQRTTRRRYLEEHPDLSIQKKTGIRNGFPVIGMTKEEVIASYGAPGTMKEDGKRAVWTYFKDWGGTKTGVLRFKNEQLVEIQVDNQGR